MPELATLKVVVDAGDAVRKTEQLGRALGETGKKAALFTDAQGRLRQSSGRYATEAEKATHATTALGRAEAATTRETDRLTRSQRELGVAGQASAKAMSGLGAALSVATLAVGARYLADQADRATLLRARLDLVTDSEMDLLRVQNALYASSQRTRTSFEDQATLFTRVARNATALGKSQSELLRFTELVSMQMQVAGTSASEASSGVLQLSQALAKGRLDGDEFRTIMESMPTVADALASSLGVTKAALYDLSAQGNITGRELVDALLKTESETRAKFATMPLTIGQAFVTVKNQILQQIGEIDRAFGLSPAIARMIQNPFGDLKPSLGGKNWNEQNGAVFESVAKDSLASYGRRITQAQADAEDAERAARQAWEAARAQATQRAAWEEEAIARAVRLGQARFAAENPGGPAAPGRSTTMMGWTPEVMRIGRGVQSLPKSMQVGAGLSVAQGASVVAAQQAIAFAEEMEQRNAQIADNWLENMQRGTGSIIADFLSGGKVAIADVWDTFKRIGAQAIGDAIAAAIARKSAGDALGAGAGGLFSKLLSNPLVIGLGLGAAVFSMTSRRSGPSYGANNTPRYETRGEDARQVAAREWLASQSRRGEVGNQLRQSVGGLLHESSAMRIVSELTGIRVGVTRLVALAESGAMGGASVNVTAPGGGSGGASLGETVDRLMGATTQKLRLATGNAVIG